MGSATICLELHCTGLKAQRILCIRRPWLLVREKSGSRFLCAKAVDGALSPMPRTDAPAKVGHCPLSVGACHTLSASAATMPGMPRVAGLACVAPSLAAEPIPTCSSFLLTSTWLGSASQHGSERPGVGHCSALNAGGAQGRFPKAA